MYRKYQFWMVGLVTGFFGGLINFTLLILVWYFIHDSFSLSYILIYLFPLVFLCYANIGLRDRYSNHMLLFGQSFRLSLLTGITSAIVMSAMAYFGFSFFLKGILNYRILSVEADLMVAQQSNQSYDNFRELSYWVRQMLSPINMALYYFIFNLILLPIQAAIIAIFVWRKKRIISNENL